MRKDIAQELAARIAGFGYRVFVAESGEHFFYTNKDGTSVVSVDSPFLFGVNISGNYISKHCGTGWQIERDLSPNQITRELIDRAITALPPYWATSGEEVRHETLATHLARYGKSSGYTELKI